MSRNSDMGIHFYMQAVDKHGEAIEGAEVKDLEVDFDGLLYSKAEGLDKKGKIKNSYTEKYADSDRLRVHFPTTPTREATTVKFTFYFIGENRRKTYDEFYAYLTGGFRAFWDTARKKRLVFFAPNEYEPANEMWYGSEPYLELNITVQNIFGQTFDVE